MKLFVMSLSLFVLLSLPGKLFAECAWVLWEKTERETGKAVDSYTTWELIDAHAEKFTCDHVKEKVWKVRADSYADLNEHTGIRKIQTVPGELVALLLKTGGYINYYFYCIPDTIDPRK